MGAACGGGEKKGKKDPSSVPHVSEHMGYFPAKNGKEPKEKFLECQVCWRGGGPMHGGVAQGKESHVTSNGCKTCKKHMHPECFNYWPDHKHLA